MNIKKYDLYYISWSGYVDRRCLHISCLQPPSLIFHTVVFHSVSLRIVANNARLRMATCVPDPPLLVMTQRSDAAMGTAPCRPFCGSLITCLATNMTLTNGGNAEHSVECTCAPSSCRDLALRISPGAMLIPSQTLDICHVQAHFRLYPWISYVLREIVRDKSLVSLEL